MISRCAALRPNERRTRLLALTLVPLALFFLRSAPPDGLPGWFPFSTSCGAITGLPCIFCGLTRALHFLLQGGFERAFYFNWLSFPLLVGAGAFIVIATAELLLGRNLLACLPKMRLTRAYGASLFIAVLLLWCLQIYLAVSQHKKELLNPAGPLYSLVVR